MPISGERKKKQRRELRRSTYLKNFKTHWMAVLVLSVEDDTMSRSRRGSCPHKANYLKEVRNSSNNRSQNINCNCDKFREGSGGAGVRGEGGL